jgi:hypothetical protein
MGERVKSRAILMAVLIMWSLVGTVVDATGDGDGSDFGPGDSITSFAGGSGTASDPYQISDVEQLQDMELNLSAHYILINDIDASDTLYWNGGKGFVPIGSEYDEFFGTLDGQNHTISDLYIDRDEGYQGLIGHAFGIKIENVGLENVTVQGRYYSGGLIGDLGGGDVINCHSTGNVSGGSNTGGLVGYMWYSGIEDCYSSGEVSGDDKVGGLVGTYIGGFYYTMKNCHSTGIVSGGYFVGGLVGLFEEATMEDCYAISTVSGENYVGGLVGHSDMSDLIDCYSIADVTGEEEVGGLGGYIREGSVSNCYSTSTVNGTSMVGGLAGRIAGAFGRVPNVKDCYSTGRVTGTSMVGGLFGDSFYAWNKISPNSFYNINATIINGENRVTLFGIYEDQFDDWLQNDKTLDIDDYLDLNPQSHYYDLDGLKDLRLLLPFCGEDHRYRLTRDVDLSQDPGFFVPFLLGTEFDGNERMVRDLNVTLPNAGIGFIGGTGSDTRLVNISLVNVNVSGSTDTGGLVGTDLGTVENCYATGVVSGGDNTGGLIGRAYDIVQDCHATVMVSGGSGTGGLVGLTWQGTIRNSHASGDVSGNYNAGGLTGWIYGGTLENCYSAGDVVGGDNVGGLVGSISNGIIVNSSATGQVSGDDNCGGFIGYINSGTVERCYAAGNVNGSERIAGLVGSMTDGSVRNSYATGNASGGMQPGGLVGLFYDGTIENCYAAGNVSEGSYTGGLVGAGRYGTILNSFWDVQTSGRTVSYGGTGLNTDAMKERQTFTDANWDFSETWDIIEDTSYPYLKVHYAAPVLPPALPYATEDVPYLMAFYPGAPLLPGCDNDITFTITSNCQWLTSTQSGLLSGTPSNSDVGTWWVDVTATDILMNSDSRNYTLTVLNANDDPEILTDSLPDATEDQPYMVVLEGVDMDPTEDVLSWEIAGTDADFLSIDPSTGSLSGIPENEDVGTWWVEVMVSDGVGGSSKVNLSLEVLNVNDDPEITTDDLASATEDTRYLSDYDGSDIDPTNDELEWTLETDASFLSMNAATGELAGTPTNDDVGEWEVTISVNDGLGGSASRVFILVVTNTNDAPTIDTSSIPDAIEDQMYSTIIEGTDIDPTGDTLTWEIAGTDTDFLEIDPSTGELTGTPDNGDVGLWQIEIEVSDGVGGTATVDLALRVINVNDEPEVLEIPKWHLVEEESEVMDLAPYILDIDNTGDLVLTCEGENITVDGLVLTAYYDDWVPEHDVGLTVSDGEAEVSFTLRVNVINVNDLPVATDVLPATGTVAKEGKTIVFSVNATDVDGDDLMIKWKDGEKVLGEGSPFKYSKLKPGEHTITVVVDDGTSAIEESVVIRVKEEKDSPGPGLVVAIAAMMLAVLLVDRRRR